MQQCRLTEESGAAEKAGMSSPKQQAAMGSNQRGQKSLGQGTENRGLPRSLNTLGTSDSPVRET